MEIKLGQSKILFKKMLKIINKTFIFLFIISCFSNLYSNENLIDELKAGEKIVFIRHALAPGNGDPHNIDLNNCNTQRNLNKTGIEQSKRIGLFFENNNIPIDKVLSSEWCRCKDTVKEMKIGKWKTFSGLNSFFQGYSNKNEVLEKLNKKLSSTTNDELVLMVTHQVVISNITGIAPPSGGIVIYNSQTRQSKQLNIQY